MIKNEREKKICDKYSKKDGKGRVHCSDCPLKKGKGQYDFRCKANSHWNKHNQEWEFDE